MKRPNQNENRKRRGGKAAALAYTDRYMPVDRLFRRAPWRAALSFVLILLMTLLLSLGIGLMAGNRRLRAKANESYITLAVLDADREIDCTALAADPAVIAGYPHSECMRSLAGYHSKNADAMQDKVIFLLSGVVPNTVGSYSAHVAEMLYSATARPGEYAVTVEGLPDGISSEDHILVHGTIGFGKTGMENIRIEPMDDAPGYLVLQKGEEIPEGYRLLAEEYTRCNSRVAVCYTSDLETVTVFHQSDRTLVSGAMFTEADYRQNALKAIVTGEVAAQMSLQVGDTIDLLGDDGNSTAYQVIGITNTTSDLVPTVYIPVEETPASNELLADEIMRLVIRNDAAAEFVTRAEELTPVGVQMTVYDQGYGTVMTNLENIGRIALIVAVLAGLLSAATLLLFAYRWYSFLKESMVTMVLLGAGRRLAAGYLLLSGGLIALSAALIGSLVGVLLSGNAVTALYLLLEKNNVKAKFYDLSSLGVSKPFALEAPVPWLAAILVSLGILAFALVLLWLFARPVVARVRKKKATPHRKNAKCRTVRAPGVFRYALTSILRSPAGSLAVPLVALVTTLTITAITLAGTTAEQQLAEASRNFVFQAELRSYNGRMTDRLLLNSESVEGVEASGLTVKTNLAIRAHFAYGGVVKGGTDTQETHPFEWPPTSYGMETLYNQIYGGRTLVFTNALYAQPEFASGAEITFAEGWDAAKLENWQDGESIPLLVEEGMMREEGIALGDALWLYDRLMLRYDMAEEDHFVVVGSYRAETDRCALYAPLGAVLQTDDGELTEHQKNYAEWLFISSHNDWGHRMAMGMTGVSPAERERALKQSLVFDSVSFDVEQESIGAFRDYLWEQGYSAPGKIKRVRTFVTVNDLAYAREIAPLERYVKTIRLLYPLIFLLVAAEGYVASYLVINGRKSEMLIMRGLGASKRHVFGTFFAEQAILCLVGGLVGLLCAVPIAGLSGGILWRWGVFLACYLLGTAASVVRTIKSDDLQKAFAALES